MADPFTFNQLLETLLAFSLVKRLSEEQQLSIHRLVQAVQEERLSPEERREWAERLVRAVHAVFPREPQEKASWQACQRYLEQVQACDVLLQKQHLLLPEAADVLDRAGTYLRERALYSLAEPLYRRMLSIREQLVGEAHPTSVQSMNHLASLYVVKGEYAAAEALYQRALPLAEQLVGAEPSLLVEVLRGLAQVYVDQGKLIQAELLYRRALPIWEQLVEAEQVSLLGILGGLAFVQAQQGEYVEAELLSQRSLCIHERHFGPEHPQVASALHALARLYVRQSKYAEAESFFLRALQIREQVGPESRIVSDSLRGLADLYFREGKYAEAEPVRSVHAKPWQHGGCVARQTILITIFLMLGAIPNLRNGPQTAVLPTVASGLQSVKRGTWEHPCKSDAGRQLVG